MHRSAGRDEGILVRRGPGCGCRAGLAVNAAGGASRGLRGECRGRRPGLRAGSWANSDTGRFPPAVTVGSTRSAHPCHCPRVSLPPSPPAATAAFLPRGPGGHALNLCDAAGLPPIISPPVQLAGAVSALIFPGPGDSGCLPGTSRENHMGMPRAQAPWP